jgi:hypothetical protein
MAEFVSWRKIMEKTETEGFIDLIALLLRKRRLWIACALAGLVFSSTLLSYNHFIQKDSNIKYSASISAIAVDYPEGLLSEGKLSALATSDVAATGVAIALKDHSAASEYRRSASAAFDPDRRVLTVSVRASTPERASALAVAGLGATRALYIRLGEGRIGLVADRLEKEAATLEPGTKEESAAALSGDAARLADGYALARLARAETEARLEIYGPSAGAADPSFKGLSAELDVARARETKGLEALAVFAGPGKATPYSRAAKDRAAALILERSRLYRVSAPLVTPEFRVMGDPTVTRLGIPPVRSVLYWILGGLLLGLFAAFIADYAERQGQNPEAVEKLKKAWARKR